MPRKMVLSLMKFLFARISHLRVRESHGHSRVTFVELFFDLVFVFAITQLSHALAAHLTLVGAAQMTVILIAVWWTWIDTTWIANWLDPEKPPVRLLMFVLMFCALVMAVAIPKAFEDRAAAVAIAYLAMQAIRDLFMIWATRLHDDGNYRNFLRISIWHLVAAPLWIAGCFVDGAERLGLWAVAVAFESAGPTFGFWVPRLSRSLTADWNVEGGHMAERCGLFIIIALGESILIIGANFGGMAWTAENFGAFAAAFAGSVAMWVVYFNIGAERASRQIASSDDPGRLARSGYTYMHIVIVAGIIVTAVGDELMLHHPHDHIDMPALLVIVGGPALYLGGLTMFKRLSAPHFPLSHLIGLGLLALLIPLSVYATRLQLVAATTVVMIVVAVWEWLSLRTRAVTTG
jgi:low temperature requirement protein LtrA